MTNRGLDSASELADWQVPATFGQREVQQDPGWESGFAEYLANLNSKDDLLDLFARFRTGENVLDATMRRVLMHSICKSLVQTSLSNIPRLWNSETVSLLALNR